MAWTIVRLGPGIAPFVAIGTIAVASAQERLPPGCERMMVGGRSEVVCSAPSNKLRELERQQGAESALGKANSADRRAPTAVEPSSSASQPRNGGGGAGFSSGVSGGKTQVGAALGGAGPRAVRALIDPNETPPRDVAGYGIVAFTTRPAPHDVERYKMICEAYKATLMSQADLPPNTPLSDQMITFWPVTNKSTPDAIRADCSYLVNNYALRVGLDAIQDADKRKEALAGHRGPFLIAWAPSESRFKPDAVVLVMDLSSFEGQRSFVEVFQDWRQQITDNPKLWRRGGFNLELVRRIIRDTFDRYGDGIMKLIKA